MLALRHKAKWYPPARFPRLSQHGLSAVVCSYKGHNGTGCPNPPVALCLIVQHLRSLTVRQQIMLMADLQRRGLCF